MTASSQIDQQVITKDRAMCAGETDHVTLMALFGGGLFHTVDGFDWVGFYRVVAPGVLKLGPHQGGHGCLVIPFDKGVCGAAEREQQTQIVDDVHQFYRHIACAASTQSEPVIPVFDKGQNFVAVLDIDLDQPAFSADNLPRNSKRFSQSYLAQMRRHNGIAKIRYIGGAGSKLDAATIAR